MGNFYPIVLPSVLLVRNAGQQLPAGLPVAGECIRHQFMRNIPQLLQELAQEAEAGGIVPSFLHQDIQDLTILIDGPPQIVTLAIDRDEHLVHTPRVAQRPLTMASALREGVAKAETPQPDGFITYSHAPLG